jgi:hypothetical protein
MKAIVLALFALQLVSSVRAETVKLTDSAFAKTTVAVVDSAFAQHQVYFSKSAIGADCGLYLTDSVFAESTVKVVKNALWAQQTVREVNSAWKANSIVNIAKTALGAFGHCDYAAALLKK